MASLFVIAVSAPSGSGRSVVQHDGSLEAGNMDTKRLAAAARVAVGVSLATLTGGAGVVNAAPTPLDPAPPCSTCEPNPNPSPTPAQGAPAKKCWNLPRQGPGGAKGGGGVPVYPPPCPRSSPPPS
jgi:hypothetical protein